MEAASRCRARTLDLSQKTAEHHPETDGREDVEHIRQASCRGTQAWRAASNQHQGKRQDAGAMSKGRRGTFAIPLMVWDPLSDVAVR